MDKVDPKTIVAGNEKILDDNGEWPNFHDAEVLDLHIWRGDMRPDDNVYIGPQITIKLDLIALEKPFVVVLRFDDCSSIVMPDFNHENPIMDLEFGIEERGTFKSGKPLPPYILVHFLPAFGFELSFKCFKASVIGIEESME